MPPVISFVHMACVLEVQFCPWIYIPNILTSNITRKVMSRQKWYFAPQCRPYSSSAPVSNICSSFPPVEFSVFRNASFISRRGNSHSSSTPGTRSSVWRWSLKAWLRIPWWGSAGWSCPHDGGTLKNIIEVTQCTYYQHFYILTIKQTQQRNRQVWNICFQQFVEAW